MSSSPLRLRRRISSSHLEPQRAGWSTSRAVDPIAVHFPAAHCIDLTTSLMSLFSVSLLSLTLSLLLRLFFFLGIELLLALPLLLPVYWHQTTALFGPYSSASRCFGPHRPRLYVASSRHDRPKDSSRSSSSYSLDATSPRMLSHLRFHRRGASNPASPSLCQPRPWSPPAGLDSCAGLDSASPDDVQSSSSSVVPPTLPPIPSVSSAHTDLAATDWPSTQLHGGDTSIRAFAPRTHGDVKPQTAATAPQARDAAHGPPSPNLSKRLPPRPTSSETEKTSSSHTGPATSFSTPTELQNSAKTPTPPSTVPGAEPPKSRKSLPFLKNSMSTLLMRRKNNHNVPDLRPLPLTNRPEEPVYDPRIRGTLVHDFSAPRHKHTAVARDEMGRPSAGDAKPSTGPEVRQLRTGSASDSTRSVSLDTTSSPAHPSPSVSSARTKASSIDQALVVANDEARPPVPPKDHPPLPCQSSSPTPAAKAADADDEESQQTTPSRCNTQSRNVSLPEISALPKHMKSTSSRFSFDMIGAAGQEKLLEERHRQRELEKKSAGVNEPRNTSDDDYDRDSIDYDAMMDDEGLEERIPGVNADAEEEEEIDEHEDYYIFGDRNNPSNTVSSLTSPKSTGVMGTSRDDDGQGQTFAVSSQATSSPGSSCLSPKTRPLSLEEGSCGLVSGLGIRPYSVSTSSAPATRNAPEDDLYFDDGLIDSKCEFAQDLAEEPETCGVPFDESIFDNNDTDQYGRPVPGAFAQAQIMRRAAMQGVAGAKRDSDVTSGASAPSAVLRSTAHTSPLVDAQQECETQYAAPDAGNRVGGLDESSLAAYQAALAAAAHEAAASGKFQRSSSPRKSEGESTDPWEASLPAIRRTEFGDDGDGMEYDDVGDLDDDAIIAEANATALAQDSDGWYGQEFGFYSTPAGQHQTLHAPGPSKFTNFEYANGGFFGPKGMSDMDHSASGRMISREPNLTPITERSEYSNRNSFMSLGLPPFSSSTPAVQSPGLSQLAAVGERGDEQMTLSALLRLRSRAWGGSQVSLASSKDGSPRSERGDAAASPWGLNAAGSSPYLTGEHGRKNSFLSTASPDSEDVSECGSPTLTMAVPVWSEPAEPIAMPSDQRQTLCSSRRSSWDVASGAAEDGNTCDARPWSGRSHHHRQRSSTDSVSYLKEEEGGETRWIMERRRTGEFGEVEILEREVVEGGRI
ncbi:hypothetical protein XA68_13644 [Ophiocordyceps unilateralis]|uniref:AGC-kinase C-terminal domain-containing protein n=1 Tax=Ophiocordyceps unilateralis TaxID=268505 RepID=A0A2A9PM32_OPHUN|nr:hypothetical protein XA68_13644 [Ophiocordyceps unilateralis]